MFDNEPVRNEKGATIQDIEGIRAIQASHTKGSSTDVDWILNNSDQTEEKKRELEENLNQSNAQTVPVENVSNHRYGSRITDKEYPNLMGYIKSHPEIINDKVEVKKVLTEKLKEMKKKFEGSK